jgi:hypothetical protein
VLSEAGGQLSAKIILGDEIDSDRGPKAVSGRPGAVFFNRGQSALNTQMNGLVVQTE